MQPEERHKALTQLFNDLPLLLPDKFSEEHWRLVESCLSDSRDVRADPLSIVNWALTSGIVFYMIENKAYSSNNAARLGRLALKCRGILTPVINKTIHDQDWEQVRELYNLSDRNADHSLVSLFCKFPTNGLAEYIISTISFNSHYDSSKVQFAEQDFLEFTQLLFQNAGQDAIRNYIKPALFKASEDFLKVVECFLLVASEQDEREIVTELGSYMSRLRNRSWSNGSRYSSLSYNRYSQPDSEEIYNNCLSLLQDKRTTATSWTILQQLDQFVQIPLHKYKELETALQNLAVSLNTLLSHNDTLLAGLLNIVSVSRLNETGLSYLATLLDPPARDTFLDALQLVDTSVARTVQDILSSLKLGKATLIYDLGGHLAMAYDMDARIWPKNHAVISKMFKPLEEAHQEFSHLASTQWERDEDALTERLCHILFQKFDKYDSDPDVRQWIKDNYKYGSLSIAEPYVRDVERTWNADIGIVVKYNIEDTLFHEWGYLIQAKKAGGDPSAPTRWDIDRRQLDDLMSRTHSGFYLLYSPQDSNYAPFVLPAKVVKSILDAVSEKRKREGQKMAHSIPYISGINLGKSWKTFFLEDILGGWAGEPDAELVARIRSGEIAHRVFEVTVALGSQVG